MNEQRINKYYLVMKKSEIMLSAATWVGLGVIMLSKVSETKVIIIWYHLFVESKKKGYKWTYLQNRE